MPYLWSETLTTLAISHGFSCRGQKGPSTACGDVEPEGLFLCRQVHGSAVLSVSAAMSRAHVQGLEADALVARDAEVAVAIQTADCVPLLLAHPPTGAVAAVHGGWRGLAAGVVESAVHALVAPPMRAELVAVIGPHIRVQQFEVGEEVVQALAPRSRGAAYVSRAYGPRPHVDLAAVVTSGLHALGVRTIEDVGGCTASEPERFFSFRRDGAGAGRQRSFVVAQPPTR